MDQVDQAAYCVLLNKMKAYSVFVGSPENGALLVFAENANRARSYAAHQSDWMFEWDYVDTSAIRVPKYDQYCNKIIPYQIGGNNELPKSASPFYDMEL